MIAVDLAELYKNVIILLRAVFTVQRQMPLNNLVRWIKKNPYSAIQPQIEIEFKTGDEEVPPDLWTPIEGTELFEQTKKVSFKTISTAHGLLLIELEYKHQIKFDLEKSSSVESFEDISSKKSPTIISGLSPSPRSVKVPAAPAKLGLGALSPHQSTNRSVQSQRSYSTSHVSPQVDIFERRPRTLSAVLSPTNASAVNPAVMGDTAIVQFMKQCENHPKLESLRLSGKDREALEGNLLRRYENAKEQLASLELWIADFKLTETLSKPRSLVESTKLMGTISPVLELEPEQEQQSTGSPSTSSNSHDNHLIFPL